MEHLSDEQIMIIVRDKDIKALSELFERYNGKLYNFFLRQTFDKELSCDLVQNVFYRIIKYKNSYNENFSFKTWIYQMARNILADHYKKEKKYDDKFKLESCADLIDVDDSEKHERHQTLFKAMKLLSDEERELLVMSKFQGMKYKEIAAITGRSVAWVKVKVHRSILKLKDLFFQIQKT